MGVKPGYKQTEVGVVPEDWGIARLTSIADVRDGTHNSPRYMERGVPFVTSKNIVAGKVDFEDITFISKEDAREINKRSKVDRDDILLSMIGTVGNAALVAFEPTFCIKNVALIKPSSSRVESRFLIQLFRSQQYGRYIDSKLDGGIQKFISLGMLRGLDVPLPPTKAEQEAIAEALSDADALIESLEQLLAKKRQLKQGAMQELLNGKKRLPGFSGEWEVRRLGDLLSRLANGAVYKATNSFGLPITRIETIADGTIDYSRTGRAEMSAELEGYKLISGDILFSHINSLDHIGKVAQFLGEQDLYHGMNLLLLRVNEYADSRFLYFWFTSIPARQKARNLARQAVSQASINTTELRALGILLPPLPEQCAIAAILSDIDVEIDALEEKLAKARQLKQGMMQELLTGRIRLA